MLDVTVSTIRLTPNLDIVAGLRNAIDLRFMHPVAIGVDRLPVDRRSVFIKLVARTAE
jgi:hypothetical protein